MGQFVHNGILYEEMPNGQARVIGPAQGSPSSAIGPAIGGNPLIPGQLAGQALTNTKERELTPLQIRAARAEAAKKELDLKAAQEAYNAAHPKASVSGLYGADFLKTLPVPDQEIVKALAEGRLGFPGGFALKAPWWQQKLLEVAQFDPTFDATNFNNRAKARATLLTGKVGASANALNTAIGHIGLLNSQIEGTSSLSGFPLATDVNSIVNAWNRHYGKPGITNFADTASKLADELETAYRNGGGAEQGVVRQLRNLDPSMSLEQKQGIVQNALELLASKQAANLYQYNIGSGGKPEVDLLDPSARAVLDKFPAIRDKYFEQPSQLSASAVGLLKANGGNPPTEPPRDNSGESGGDAPPVIGGGGVPHADYSGMVGGPRASLATMDPNSKIGAFKQTYRNEYDPVMAGTLSAFIRNGAPYETAAAFAQSHGFNSPDPVVYNQAVEFAKAHGGATNVEASRSVPTTFGERVASSPAAAFVTGAGSAGTAGLLDTGIRSIVGPEYDANRAALAATNPTADLLGNMAGGAAGMFAGGSVAGNLLRAGAKGGIARNALAIALKNPVKTGIVGDTAYGSLYGANENPNDPLAGAGIGAAAGLVGGGAGNLLTTGVGAALRGVTDPAIQRLRQAGIPLTVGEVLGGGFKKAQDAMTSVFGPGNMVARRYADGRNALNQTAFDQASQIIGAPINGVGQRGIRALDAAKSQAYANALDPISLDLNTPQAIDDIGGALNAARAIPNADQASDIATGGLANYIGNAAPNGVMAGRDFQQAYRGLSRLGRQSNSRVYGHEINQALGQGQDALVGALESQNPGAYADFLRANSANRHLSVLADAVNAAKNQIGDSGEPLFTPAQLGTAASANARTYSGRVASASGNRPFNQLATDAQQVMSSKLPESGTFPRQLMGLALTGGISGAGGMFGGQENGVQGAAEGAAIPLGLLTLLGTRRGQQLLTAALLNRPEVSRVAGRALMRNPQVGGDILTAAGIPLLAGP
jgi:hypothetical protein